MSIPFSRSTRSLQADSYRPTLIGLIISTALLTLWTAWFLFAQIPVTEISQSIVKIERNIVTANFPLSIGETVQQRQKATIYIGPENQPVSAEVINVKFQPDRGQAEIDFFILEPVPTDTTTNQTINEVELIVSTISPAILVIDAAQQLSP